MPSEGPSGWQEVLNSVTKCLGLCSNHKVKSQSLWVMQITISKAFCQPNAFCNHAYLKTLKLQECFTFSSITTLPSIPARHVGLSCFRARERQHYRKWKFLFFDLFICSYMLLYILFIYCSSAAECTAQLPQKCHHLCLYQLCLCCRCTNEM